MAVPDTRKPEYDSRLEIDGEKTVTEAILEAFENAGVDHMGAGTTLDDALDPDALNRIFSERREENTALLAVELWGKRALIRSDEIRIYDP